MKSVWVIYLVIVVYYLLGTAGIYFINRKKDTDTRRKAWIKHVTYFILISLLYFSIAIKVILFRYVAVLIIIAGFLELTNLYIKSGYRHILFFGASLMILALLSAAFFSFTGMGQGLILFAFLILCIFDGFSQVTGQLLGKRKLLPRISPNKTVEGLIRGSCFDSECTRVQRPYPGRSGEVTDYCICCSGVCIWRRCSQVTL
ncbi:MAG: phosphatidate cytidylyltransferase [Bacteroidales bacterium]|nr:phosphatidate cytidylyltransferase [Bacteroidales bacterium]